MQHLIPPQNRFHREQRQNRQRSGPKLRVRNRGPRQHSQQDVTGQRDGQAIHFKQILRKNRSGFRHQALRFRSGAAASLTLSLRLLTTKRPIWCTGKDSNLRTSLGGTDLQSVGFNHSPTCANSRAMRLPRSTPANRTGPGASKSAGQTTKTANMTKRSTAQKFNFRQTGKPRLALFAVQIIAVFKTLPIKPRRQICTRRSLHAGKVPNGVCLGKPVAPANCPPPPAGIFY
jgi:hypothetical protein